MNAPGLVATYLALGWFAIAVLAGVIISAAIRIADRRDRQRIGSDA